MVEARVENFVAECFWPDVHVSDLEALDRRVVRATAELNRRRPLVRYLGSILLRDDEVVLCRFEGTAETVRVAAERARIPFERILAAGCSPWRDSSDLSVGSARASQATETERAK
jgi:hypothetical protein